MNIFPNKLKNNNRIKEEFKNDFKNYTESKSPVIKFPSPIIYKQLNEQLLRNYLQITKKKEFENKVINNVVTQSVHKEKEIYNIDFKINIDSEDYNLFVYEVSNKTLKEHMDFIYKNNYKFIFDLEDIDIENINKEKIFLNIPFENVMKTIFKTTIKEMKIPHHSNLWIFSKNNSIIIQSTYIPMEEGSYTDNDYLDLINNCVIGSYLNFDSETIYGDINFDKTNEKLFFLIFK